jgi:hypothetical protein
MPAAALGHQRHARIISHPAHGAFHSNPPVPQIVMEFDQVPSENTKCCNAANNVSVIARHLAAVLFINMQSIEKILKKHI